MAKELTDQNLMPAPFPRPSSDSSAPISIGAALARARSLPRAALPFRAVNRADTPDYNPGFQRHHLLPKQLLQQRCFGPLFNLLGRDRLGFDDFRANGLLLPASDAAALRIGLPLHRGPHRDYNSLVIERVGQVEASWSARRLRAPEVAASEAAERLGILQKALRRRLLDPKRKRLTLNRFDPLGRELDFSEIDAMVDTLWPETDTEAFSPWPAPPEPFQPVHRDCAQVEAEMLLIRSEPEQPWPDRPGGSAFAF